MTIQETQYAHLCSFFTFFGLAGLEDFSLGVYGKGLTTGPGQATISGSLGARIES